MLGVTPIESLFSCVKPNFYGAGYESTLVEKCPQNSESIYLHAKSIKSGVEDVKTLSSNEITTVDFKEFNYDSCSLIECISLMQSMLNSPHAYSQNKAFTDHIVDAVIKSLEEKLELEVSIPRKLHDEWEPTIKIKIKNYERNALCDLGASVSATPKSLCDVLGFNEIEECADRKSTRLNSSHTSKSRMPSSA